MRNVVLPSVLALSLVVTACAPDAPTEPSALAPDEALLSHGSASENLPAGNLSATIKAVRAATARYQSLDKATTDGYHPHGPCISAEMVGAPSRLGAMGFHFVNEDLVDGTFEPLRPEVVLYEPGPQGQMRLVAVEYLINGEQPEPFMGAEFTKGHVADWELHAWVWEENPIDMFFPFNPNVSCEFAEAE